MRLTFAVIGICIVVFLLQMAGIFPNSLSFTPATFKVQPYTLVTSMFMHSGFQHILLNMIGLFTFGTLLETVMGKKEWLILYLSSGFIASLGYALLSSSPFIPAVGASGAIFGLIGGMALLRPKQIIYTAYGPIPMAAAAVVWGVIEFISLFNVDNIAHSAHLFGLIGGVIIAVMFIKQINWKYMLVLLFVPPILIAAFTLNLPMSIEKPDLNLPECYSQIGAGGSTITDFSLYRCGNDSVFEYVRPKTSTTLASNVEEIIYLTEDFYKMAEEKNCTANAVNIDGDKSITTVEGTICDENFYGRTITCEYSNTIVIQISRNQIEKVSFNCK